MPAPSKVTPNTGMMTAYITPAPVRFVGCTSSALAAVVATLSVAVVVPFAGGVTLEWSKLQVGPFVTTGDTVHCSCTAELKPFVEVTVVVEVAETPACPEVFDNAPLVTVKLALEVEPVEYFATNASVFVPYVV